MSASRTLALGATAAALLLAAGLGATWWLTEEGGQPGAHAPAPVVGPPAATTRPAPPLPAPLPERPAGPPALVRPSESLPPAPAGSPAAAVSTAAASVPGLGAALAPLQPRLARCASEQGGGAYRRGQATLTLEVEPGEGEVTIAGVSVRSRGSATPEALECAMGLLRGRTVPASGARPGPRLSVPYPLRF